MIERIDHVSIAVRDHKRAVSFFRDVLGAVEGPSSLNREMKYLGAVLSLGDLSRVELLSPSGKGSFLDNFLAGREGGVHHIALQTLDIEGAKSRLDELGIPYFGFYEYPDGNWKELFIHPRDAFGVLIQIAEFDPDDYIDDSLKLPAGKRWTVEKDGDDGVRLTLAHPGGGTVTIGLGRDEAKGLAEDLRRML